jgi:hypothetical protein
MIKNKTLAISMVLILPIVLSSCIGIDAEININRNGSGTIALEYRVSNLLESLGKLEGNEGLPPIPVGRADFERTVNRIPGLDLQSFSSKPADRDVLYTVKLGFSNLEALIQFLDSTGQGAALSREGGKTRFSLSLDSGSIARGDAQLLNLLTIIAEGYVLDIRLNAPQDAELSFRSSTGRLLASPPVGTASSQGS